MDEVTTTTIVKDALDALLNEVCAWAEEHDGHLPVSSLVYAKARAALRLLEEEK